MTHRRDEVITALAERIGTPPLTAAEIESILSLAAVAAHTTGDRTTAPLASYLAGVAVAGTDDRVASLDELRRHIAERSDAPTE